MEEIESIQNCKMNPAQEIYYKIKREALYLPYMNFKDDEFLFSILNTEKPKLIDNKMQWTCPDKKSRYMTSLDVLVDRGMCTRSNRYP